MSNRSRADVELSAPNSAGWLEDKPFVLALAVSVVAHVLVFVFGPSVKVPVPAPRKVLEVKLIAAERKPPPPPPPEVVPEPPKLEPPKGRHKVAAKQPVAKSRARAFPKLAAQVQEKAQGLPEVTRSPSQQPQVRGAAVAAPVTRPDALPNQRVEARPDVAQPSGIELPAPVRAEVSPRPAAARPEVAPVARADARVEMPRLEAQASAAIDVDPALGREPPARSRREVAIALPRVDPAVRPTIAAAPTVSARPEVAGEVVTLPSAGRPETAVVVRRDPAPQVQRDAPQVQRPQAPIAPAVPRTDDRAEAASLPVIRNEARSAEPRLEARPDIKQEVRSPAVTTSAPTVQAARRVDKIPAPVLSSTEETSAHAADPRVDSATAAHPRLPETVAAAPRTATRAAPVTPKLLAPDLARSDEKVVRAAEPSLQPGPALHPRIPEAVVAAPRTAAPDAPASPKVPAPVLPRANDVAAKPADRRPEPVTTLPARVSEVAVAAPLRAASEDAAAPRIAAPAVAGTPRELPRTAKPKVEQPSVAPVTPAANDTVVRAVPAPALKGPTLQPTQEGSPHIGRAKASVVAAGRPTLGQAPRGQSYDREAADKYAHSVAAAIERRVRYPRLAERSGITGSVEVMLTYDSRGRFVEATVTKSSGHKSLDDAALDAANAVMARMGRAPDHTTRLTIPYTFKIDNR